MKVIKKVLISLMVILILFTNNSIIFAAEGMQAYTYSEQSGASLESDWDSFRGSDTNNGVADLKTPTTAAEAVEKWFFKLKEAEEWSKNISEPVMVGDYIFIIVDNNLIKLNKEGTQIAELELDASIDFISRMVCAEGIIYIPLSLGKVQAVDSRTMESIWKTESIDGYQSINTLLYKDGYLYGAITKADWSSSSDGRLFCIEVTDKDTSSPTEIKTPIWYQENAETGYYWAGPVIVNDILMIGDDAGNIASYSLNGEKIDSRRVAAEIRSTVVAVENDAYFTDYAGNLNKVTVYADGTLSDVKSVKFGAGSTSTPAIYNGRAYVGGHDSLYNGVLAVIDTATMKVIYTADTPGNVQAAPLVSTAYASEDNCHTVYVYFTANTIPGALYYLTDNEITTHGITKILYTPGADKQNYCMASVSADSDGNLYYSNDAGYLFCITKKAVVVGVNGIKLNKDKDSVEVRKSIQLSATVLPSNAKNRTVIWKSANTNIATVTQTGKVTGIKKGSTDITVTTKDGNYKAVCKLTVNYAKTSKITITAAGLATNQKVTNLYIVKGKKITIKGKVSPSTAKQGVKYSTKNNKVASVSQKGVIKGVKVGTTSIYVKSADGKKTVRIILTVVKEAKKITCLKAVKKTITVKAGKTTKITTKVLPKTTANRLTYKIRNKKIAKVNAFGIVTGVKKGNTKITIKCGSKIVYVNVTVK